MEHGTDNPPEQPSPAAPRPNHILAQPATVDACRADYEQAADIRQTIAAQDARARR